MILVINTGSSSLKYRLFDMGRAETLAAGVIERIGEPQGIHTYETYVDGEPQVFTEHCEIKDHRSGMHFAAHRLIDPDKGVIERFSQIEAIGHRVVQGGEAFGAAVFVDDAVKKAVRGYIPLAPLHNPSNLAGIEVAQALFPGIPNVAVFDTQFHHDMPAKAFRYALPERYYSEHRIRRYGFHGTSHKYVSEQAARLMEKDIGETSLITVHLGNGCSICAVENGRSIDTSMGMTPLGGIMMGTRSGDMDPAIISFLAEHEHLETDEVVSILNTQSGFKGICGLSDLRDIHTAAENGSAKAVLAIEMFCYQIKKYIGAYTAVLGRVDAVVFTGGIGENNAFIREKICENLSPIGIWAGTEKTACSKKGAFSFHTPASPVQLWVIPTNEELQIAKEVVQVLKI